MNSGMEDVLLSYLWYSKNYWRFSTLRSCTCFFDQNSGYFFLWLFRIKNGIAFTIAHIFLTFLMITIISLLRKFLEWEFLKFCNKCYLVNYEPNWNLCINLVSLELLYDTPLAKLRKWSHTWLSVSSVQQVGHKKTLGWGGLATSGLLRSLEDILAFKFLSKHLLQIPHFALLLAFQIFPYHWPL